MNACRRLIVAIGMVAVMMVSSSATAAVQTFNALFFKPATGRNPYLMLHGVDTLHKFQFQVGEFFSYGYRPLEVRQNNQRITGVIDHSLVADFVAAFGITEWMQIGLDFPLVMINRFQDPNIIPPAGYSNKFSISDMRFEFKARVFDACNSPVGLAFVPFVTIPTGDSKYYVGDSGLTGGVIAVAEGRITRNFGFTGNIGYRTGKKVQFRNLEWQHRLLLGLGTYFQFGKGVNLFAEVNAETAFEHFFNDRDMTVAEGLVGVKWDIKETGLTLNAGAGSCFICGVKGAMARTALGLTYRWNPPKYRELDDGFGKTCERAFAKGLTVQQYYELSLKCPPDPAAFRPGVDDDACPKYYELREVAELLWRCPSKPEDFVPGVHDDACQKVYTLMDNYSDQEIWNAYTLAAAEMGLRCPQNPAEFNPALHDQACPKYYELREISLLSRNCPENAADFKQGVHDDACPKFYELRSHYTPEQWAVVTLLSKRDTDRDSINDYLDVCPTRQEDFNNFADQDGCPDGGVVAVSGGEIVTYDPVYFAFNSTQLAKESKQIIDLVIGAINANTWIKRVRIAGNADAIGSPQANLKISKRRAQVVIDYMRSRGVRRGVVLIPVGYGAGRPVASNQTERGRALNRRVTFAIDKGARSSYVPPRNQRPVRARPTAQPSERAAPIQGSSSKEGVPSRWDY